MKLLAYEIIQEFEMLLDRKGISIPNPERTGDPKEARIFGSDYYDLENNIVKILEKGGDK